MIQLSYRDGYGLRVEIFGVDKDFALAVYNNGEIVAVAHCVTVGDAQGLARLLVGIEIQPDGAAWKRGPRPPARPTDASGKIIEPVADWQPIETIPFNRPVIIKTVRGLIRRAKAAAGERLRAKDQWGPERRHCFGCDPSSDLMAVAWREED